MYFLSVPFISGKCIFSGPFQCGGVGLRWQVHLNITISLSWISSSMSNEAGLKFPVFSHLTHDIQPTNQIASALLTFRASTLNTESLLSETIPINSAWSNFMFFPGSYHTINFNFRGLLRLESKTKGLKTKRSSKAGILWRIFIVLQSNSLRGCHYSFFSEQKGGEAVNITSDGDGEAGSTEGGEVSSTVRI